MHKIQVNPKKSKCTMNSLDFNSAHSEFLDIKNEIIQGIALGKEKHKI